MFTTRWRHVRWALSVGSGPFFPATSSLGRADPGTSERLFIKYLVDLRARDASTGPNDAIERRMTCPGLANTFLGFHQLTRLPRWLL